MKRKHTSRILKDTDWKNPLWWDGKEWTIYIDKALTFDSRYSAKDYIEHSELVDAKVATW